MFKANFTRRILGITIIFGFMIFACTKNSPPNELSPDCVIKQKVLFQMVYENFAWGYQGRGIFIDNKGLIKSFSIPSKESWRRSNSGLLSKEDLEHNYQLANSIIGRIDKNELCSYYQLIKSASNTRLSKLADTGRDMGSMTLVAYQWDNEKQQCEVVFLSREGDSTQDNLNPDAIAISNWLRQKFNRPRMFPTPPPQDNK
jgi:hypothetical protein